MLNRRSFLAFAASYGVFAITHGMVPKPVRAWAPILEPVQPTVLKVREAATVSTTNMMAALKELYGDDPRYLKDLVYAESPFLALALVKDDYTPFVPPSYGDS